MHQAKAGTPTMGGVALVGASVAGYLIAHAGTHVAFSRAGILVVAVMMGAAGIGFVDDWIKVRHQRSLGLNKRAKFAAQVLVALGFALAAEHWAGVEHPSVVHPLELVGDRPGAAWAGWCGRCSSWWARPTPSTSPTGSTVWPRGRPRSASPCLAIIGYWQFRHYSIYHVAVGSRPGPRLGRAWPVPVSGSCGGTRRRPGSSWATPALWPSARAWPLCALQMNLQLLLPVIGGLFVIVTLSVVDPGDQLPGLRPTCLPHGAAAPSLRAPRLARDDGDRAFLDPRPASSPPSASDSSTPTSCRSPR